MLWVNASKKSIPTAKLSYLDTHITPNALAEKHLLVDFSFLITIQKN